MATIERLNFIPLPLTQRTTLCILILVFSSRLAVAQDTLLNVKGAIYDENNVSLPFTSVYLFNIPTTSKPIKGIQSDENGVFSLDIQPGKYQLRITLVGYKPYVKELTLNSSSNIGKIFLETDQKVLAEVNVTAKKPLVSRKIDRYVLNIAGSALSTGRGTFELLNYAPGVITMGNSISINGNTATKIMVNGRMLRLSGEQVQNYLVNLRSEDVESIEVIPTPGAEYEAEGGGGLINVVLKKQHSSGFSGTIGLGATTPIMPSFNTNAQFSYGYKGLQLYGSHNYTKRKAEAKIQDFRSQADLNYSTDINTITSSRSNNTRAGIAYDLSKVQYIGFEFNSNSNSSDASSISQAVLNDFANNRFNRIKGNFQNRRKNKINTLSVNYKWDLDTLGSALNIIADYTNSNRDSRGDFQSNYHDQQDVSLYDSVYKNRVPVNVKNYNISIDYTQVFSKAGQLKLGAKYTTTDTKNDVYYEYLQNGEFINDLQRSNRFQYKEKITAFYAQYLFNWDKLNFQIGLRGENTESEGLSVTLSNNTTQTYFNLFPSVSLKREITKNHVLSLSYRKRLDRPAFNSLNPFEWRIDDYTYITGNPYLKPQFTHSLNLSYLLMNKYDLTLFFSRTNDQFAQYLTSDGINANYRWENLSSGTNYGANLYIPVDIAKWWTMSNNLLVYNNVIEFSTGKSDKTVFSLKTTQNINLQKDLRLEISAFYQSKYNVSNQIFVPNYQIDMGLSSNLFKKKVTARALVTDLFNTSKMDYYIISDNLNLQEKQKYTTRTFSIQLIYNFSLGHKVKVQKIEAGNKDEKNRM